MNVVGHLALALLLSASPLDDAKKHLDAGKLDDVLFSLEGESFTDAAEKTRAADLLAAAGQKSLAKKDEVFALQFAQMALRHVPAHPLALEVGARACLAQQQYGPAETYADQWMAVVRDALPRVLRAQIAAEQGEWQRALQLTDGLSTDGLTAKEKVAVDKLRASAQAELAERQSAVTEVKALEAQMLAAQEKAARDLETAQPSGRVKAASASGDVILYRTAWCGYCRKAADFLRSKKVRFVERDIEKDGEAALELAQKAAAVGIRPGGVPVIDVKGTLVVGFDRNELERLLD